MAIDRLIADCEAILDHLSGYSGEPNIKAIERQVKQLNQRLTILDKRIGKILPYYSSTRIGYMGWSKHHVAHALLKIHTNQSYEARQQLISAVDSLRKLDTALKQALT